jgi:hypothetical protein
MIGPETDAKIVYADPIRKLISLQCGTCLVEWTFTVGELVDALFPVPGPDDGPDGGVRY